MPEKGTEEKDNVLHASRDTSLSLQRLQCQLLGPKKLGKASEIRQSLRNDAGLTTNNFK